MRSSYLYALVASILSSAVPALPADFPTLEEFQDTIDKYGTNAWRQVGCDAGVLPDALKDPEGQWKDSKADDAWKDAVAKWKKEKPENAKFPTWLANYFNAPPGFACEKLATGECQSSLACGNLPEKKPVNSPAGYIILNQMRMVHSKFESYYWGLYNTHQMMDASIESFITTFSPTIDPMKAEKILLDILGVVLATTNAGTFNVMLRGFARGSRNPNTLSQTKDTINALVAGTIVASKDMMSAFNQIAKLGEMKDYFKDTVQAMIDNWGKVVERIFTDPDQIYTFIKNGFMWDPGNVTTPEDVRPQLEHMLYGYLLPHAWASSNALKGPMFIATSENVDQKDGETGCKSYDPGKMAHKKWGGWDHSIRFNTNGRQNNPVLGESIVCDGEEAFWMVALEKEKDPDLTAAAAWSPPGWNKFSPDEWGGISREEIALNAIASWKANGKKDGWTQPTEDEMIMLDEIKKFPRGMISIPVCSWYEAAQNMKKWRPEYGIPEDKPHFPCGA